MDRHENPRSGRGRGTAVCSDDPITSATLHDALSRACAEVGIVDRDVPADGRWHKTDIDGDPRGRGDGRIKLFPDGEGGIVCNWKGETLPFFVDDGRKLTEAERRDRKRKRAESIRRAREEEARRHAGAARKASAIWKPAQPAPRDHPYLTRKQTQAHEARLYRGSLVVDGMPCDGSLIVPACDGNSAIHTLEFIHPETRGGDNKRFLPGGDLRGRYFSIGTMEGAGPLCLCEGYATGASIHEATGCPVAVAFNAGNLGPVAKAMRKRFPELRLLLCADDDAGTPGNPGLTKATEAAQAVDAWMVVPDFGQDRPEALKDFNDLAVLRGLEAVAECIRRQVESGAGEGAPEEDETGSGNGAAPSDEIGSFSSGQDEGGDHAIGDAEDLEATVRRLAGLSPIEYDRERKAKAKQLGMRVATLDTAVEKARRKLAGDGNDSQKAEYRVKTTTEPRQTDLGNALRFAREHQNDTRYCWPWRKWLVWNGRFWAHDDSGAVHRLAEQTVRALYQEAAAELSMLRREALGKWALKSESHDRRVKMLASGQAIEGIPVRPRDLDRDPMLLNCRNGTLDLRTGTLRPHERKDYITLGLDLDYDPDAKCPVWKQFISQVFGEVAETIAFLQRALGHSLTGDVREDAFFILYGAGSNGKSTLINPIVA